LLVLDRIHDDDDPVLPLVVVHVALKLLARVAVSLYASTLKYTDVDYRVYTDAARHIVEGNSPYDRHTYRYSPLLAYLMVPSIIWSPVFGKLMFIMFDILSGYLIYCIVKADGVTKELTAKMAAAAWLYNPLVMNVSTRGSAESLIITLVLLTLHLYHQRVFILTGIFYGLAIHFKIYPIIYCLSLYIPLTNQSGITIPPELDW